MEQDTIDLLKDLVAIDSQNPSPGWRRRSWRGRRGGLEIFNGGVDHLARRPARPCP
jgi:hypothetical protein